MSLELSSTESNNPLLILHRELKGKPLKKSALESLTTISISLGRKKTREQLIPYLKSIFVDENHEVQKCILIGLGNLLHPVYIGKPHHSRLILELVIDVLCVYSNKEIRTEAYVCLEKVFTLIDVKKAQGMLLNALKKLNEQGDDPNIRELIIRMIPLVYPSVEEERERELIEILHSFLDKLSDKKIVSLYLTDFIKIMPPAEETEIRNIISELLKTADKEILANLIHPIVLLTKISGEKSTFDYLKIVIESEETLVVCASLKKYEQLSTVFKPEVLTPILKHIENFDNEPQEVKNTILEVLDSFPLNEEALLKLCQPPSSLQLKNTLADTLCKMEDVQALLRLFNSSDPNFQVKVFPKLPPVAEFHIEVVGKIMNSKSWRQKLTVLQNIEIRTKKNQQTELLLPKLTEFFADRIACVRVALAETISNIVIQRQVGIQKLLSLLQICLKSENWFERQAVYRCLEMISRWEKLPEKDGLLMREAVSEIKKKEKIVNIRIVLDQINKNLDTL